MTTSTFSVDISISDCTASLTIVAVKASETVNKLFEISVDLTTSDDFDADALVGNAALLDLTYDDAPRYLHGILSEITLTAATDTWSSYTLKIVPEVWPLSQGSARRIFRDCTVTDILDTLLAEWSITNVEKSLLGSYTSRSIATQYDESPWAFLSRLMEDEGIYYFFRHEEAATTLVIADHGAAYMPIGDSDELVYDTSALITSSNEHVLSLLQSSRIRPGKVSLRSVELYTPTQLTEDTASSSQDTNVEVYAYPDSCAASRRLEAYQVTRSVIQGTARCVRLSPGLSFSISGHPKSDLNTSWLLTAVEHRYSASENGGPYYLASFTAAASGSVPRPLKTTPRPRIQGPQPALIVGPTDTELYVDSLGRVQVKLLWDRTASSDLTSALWVHTAQTMAGALWGSMVVPRVGSYALVEFLGGDPDRPVITGYVHTELTQTPYTLPDNQTKTALVTKSSPDSQGYNELTFEDAAGSEEVYLRAERDLNVEVLNNATRTVGVDDTVTVGGSRSVSVGGSSTTTVTVDDTVTVGVAQAITVGGARAVSVGGALVESTVLTRTTTVGSDNAEAVGGDHQETVAGDFTLVVGTAVDATDASASPNLYSVTINGDEQRQVTGDQSVSVSGNQSLTVEGTLQPTIHGETQATLTGLLLSITGKAAIDASDELQIESETALKLGGPSVYVSGDDTIHLRAYTSIILEVASATGGDSTKLTLEAGKVTITNGDAKETLTDGTIKLNC